MNAIIDEILPVALTFLKHHGSVPLWHGL
ncbi:hypothetical protein BOSEA31B_13753 [Hyphomicrobiales bacterium]|nr:hypothetical protein BOSEA31B_13753 [Hyphomicrobiales bacterium]CAI0343311.1 hypothetical protein BO1005MUT1_220110 [Hyphomicrobiales bacterium]